MPSLVTFLAVAVGGALGALSRVSLGDLVGTDPLHLATLTLTLTINTLGALGLGFLTKHAAHLPPALVAGVGVGFLGSFTTWSAVVAASWLLTGAGNVLLAGGYLVLTVALGVLAAWLSLGKPVEATS